MERAREAKRELYLCLRSLPAEWREIFLVRRLCSSEFCFILTDILFSNTSKTVPYNHFYKVYFRSRVSPASHFASCSFHTTLIVSGSISPAFLCAHEHTCTLLFVCVTSSYIQLDSGGPPASTPSATFGLLNQSVLVPSGCSGQPESNDQSLPTWTVVR